MTPVFVVEVDTSGHEVYAVDVETEEEARLLVEDGNAGSPFSSEVLSMDVIDVRLEDGDAS